MNEEQKELEVYELKKGIDDVIEKITLHGNGMVASWELSRNIEKKKD